MAGKHTHWADEAADKIIREKGKKDVYTCASGITPSGTVHVGNFREIISVDLVARALRSKEKKVRFIYSWDDFDVFRKVPANMPDPGALERYLRFPITEVPDPWRRDESYARHHEVDVERVLPEVGIYPEYLYQSQKYRASTYAEGIRKALEKRDALKAALDKFRDEEHKIEGDWWPVGVFCAQCRHDETEIAGWDGAWALSYHCTACGHRETVDIRTARDVKLGWRVDWPMRWAFEKVDFEPAGKDHHSQGGSFDTSRLVCKEVYDYDAPVTFRYDFIGIKGNPGKMSSSKGAVVDLRDLLKVYTPELVRYLFAGTRPNTEFTISFDLDVIKIYEDYDKTERIAFGLEKAKDEETAAREKRIYELSQVDETPFEERPLPYQAPFRHFCNLIQIADGDAQKAVDGLPGIKDEQKPRLLARGKRALYWLDECAPDEFRFRLRPAGEIAADVPETVKQAIAALRDKVVAHIEMFPDDKTCAQAVYDTAGELGIEGKDLFRAAYQALIGKDQGPRLANFLRSIDQERLLGILAGY
ncbi:MAG: lysine--tRNA ligase [Spirochaetaceae bacterium]|jgi:lysyl-tRNA synthetase class 1|nr:lysine--tRNA ligase [Spirochaetaceae bacterium]